MFDLIFSILEKHIRSMNISMEQYLRDILYVLSLSFIFLKFVSLCFYHLLIRITLQFY